MKIIPDINKIYSLMRQHNFETVRQLSSASGITRDCLYGVFDKGSASKETYWRLAKFFGCHIEDLQIMKEVNT